MIFLVKGDQSVNVNLKDNDVIRFQPILVGWRWKARWNVREFSKWKGESFRKLLALPGFYRIGLHGIGKCCYKTDKEFKVRVKASEFDSCQPREMFSGKILNRFENRIENWRCCFQTWCVFFYEGMRISNLLLRPMVWKKMPIANARITRLKTDLTTEIVSSI
jgi:hypothetical protein